MEITEIPLLQPDEIADIEQHSLLNLLSVLQGELICIGLDLADDANLLEKGMASCMRIKETFRDPEKTKKFAQNAPSEANAILTEIDEVMAKYPGKSEKNTKTSRDNIESVLQILQACAQDTLTRLENRAQWLELTPEDHRAELLQFLAAVEKNSKGRFGIVYSSAQQKPTDYYVGINIKSSATRPAMPILIKDSIRDIIANARKYTSPGGIIKIDIQETDTELKIAVQDTGCGIPPTELKTVFHYGQRGSNSQQMQTMGAGLGLTKAFVVTKQFGGRLWITSELEVGTCITIVIPRPKPLRNFRNNNPPAA